MSDQRPAAAVRTGLHGCGRAGQVVLVPVLLHLAAVTVAGLRLPPAPPCGVARPWRITVVVPAHDEQDGLPATLAALAGATPPHGGFEVVVVADHCTDRTAEVARVAGARVLERTDQEQRGKGPALRWAFDLLLAEDAPPDAVAVVDADTLVDVDFLVVAEQRLTAGAAVVQGRYLTAPPSRATTVSRLAVVSAACQSVLRPRGRARLGGAAKLQGNGMVLRREVLEAVPWDAFGVAEDVGYWFRLLRAGVHPVHEPRAGVRGSMPTGLAAARVQRARWEQGRAEVVAEQLRPALRQALRTRDAVLAEAVFSELVAPPLALLGAAAAAAGAVRIAAARPGSSRRRAVRTAGLQVGVVGAHVLAAVRVAGAPRSTYAVLLTAPAVVVWKVAVKAGTVLSPSSGWNRTPRT